MLTRRHMLATLVASPWAATTANSTAPEIGFPALTMDGHGFQANFLRGATDFLMDYREREIDSIWYMVARIKHSQGGYYDIAISHDLHRGNLDTSGVTPPKPLYFLDGSKEVGNGVWEANLRPLVPTLSRQLRIWDYPEDSFRDYRFLQITHWNWICIQRFAGKQICHRIATPRD